MKKLPIFLIILSALLTGCGEQEQNTVPAAPPTANVSETAAENTSAADTSQSAQTVQNDLASEENWEPMMFYDICDIDNNKMRFGDTISTNKVTMVNVWGTFCGPCKSEMPDIEALYKKYAPEGFGVVGLTCDIYYNGSIDSGALKDAQDIKKELGITYPLLIETSELDAVFPTEYVPATFFLDSSGKVIDETYVGSNSKADWEKIIKKNISKVK